MSVGLSPSWHVLAWGWMRIRCPGSLWEEQLWVAIPSLHLSPLGSADQKGRRVRSAASHLLCSLHSPIPYEELVRLIDEASEKNLSVSILTQVMGQGNRGSLA